MKSTTHERLRRTAAEAVDSIPGIEAVLLYGSRARGTARAASDWDVAILLHAGPAHERAATRLFDAFERVHSIGMRPESIEAHCNQGTRLDPATRTPYDSGRPDAWSEYRITGIRSASAAAPPRPPEAASSRSS